jgi:hypothetical protein
VLWRADAATRIVDQRLAGNTTTYNATTRQSTGGTTIAYNTLQGMLNGGAGGDTLLLRGAIYNPPSTEGFDVPNTFNGTALDWSCIRSYPGEWAIIDGQNTSWLGLAHDAGSGPETDNKYLIIEDFEIRNCRDAGSTRGVGLYLNGGPLIVQRLYIHDCGWNCSDGNNPAGFRSYRLHNSIVRYNYFRHNGGMSHINQGHIMIWANPIYGTTTIDTSNALITFNNDIKYNLFDSADCGFRIKVQQHLASDTYLQTLLTQSCVVRTFRRYKKILSTRATYILVRTVEM